MTDLYKEIIKLEKRLINLIYPFQSDVDELCNLL